MRNENINIKKKYVFIKENIITINIFPKVQWIILKDILPGEEFRAAKFF